MKEWKSSSIAESRIQALEEIWFVWSLNVQYKIACDKKYEELKQFKCHVGHCNVPWGFHLDHGWTHKEINIIIWKKENHQALLSQEYKHWRI